METTDSEYDLVTVALAAVSLGEGYVVKFKQNEMNDRVVSHAIQTDPSCLKALIPNYVHFVNFIDEFTTLTNSKRKDWLKGVQASSPAVNRDSENGNPLKLFKTTLHSEKRQHPPFPIAVPSKPENTDPGISIADEVLLLEMTQKCRKYYETEMDKMFKARTTFIQPRKFKEIHDKLLKLALKYYVTADELSRVPEAQVLKAGRKLFRKYEETNNLRRCPNQPVIGIDLGTTNACVAVFMNGETKIISDTESGEGKQTVPSFVLFKDDDSVEVGLSAKESSYLHPRNTVFDAKRLIGRRFSDPLVQMDIKYWPFKVIDKNRAPVISVQGSYLRPEEVSAKVLGQLKLLAEKHLKQQIHHAVVTVPAYFNDAQRRATKDAALLAGLEAKLLNEPTAAAIAYKLHMKDYRNRNVVVFDLGGGTFDVAVIAIENGTVVVKAIGGDTHLGGEDFDHAMVTAVVEKIKAYHEIDITEGLSSKDARKRLVAVNDIRRLRFECEKKKRKLSIVDQVSITVHNAGGRKGAGLEIPFTREEFNKINEPLFQKCIVIVKATLKDAGLTTSDIHDVVLIGGSSRIPRIQQMLKSLFKNKSLDHTINPDESVALGAAYYAAVTHGNIQMDQDDLPFQGDSFNDVTSHSIGIGTYLGTMKVFIPRNTSIPCSVTHDGMATVIDNQSECSVRIYEGEDEHVSKNTLLGHFILSGVPPAPAGTDSIQCTLQIDEEGVLSVEGHVIRQDHGAPLQLIVRNFNE